MKHYFFALLFIVSSVWGGDDLQRLDLMVKDIEQLRFSYDNSQKLLEECKSKLFLQEDKDVEKISKMYKNRINDLENQIKKLKKQIKSKDKIQEVKTIEKVKIKEVCSNSLNNKNEFPKLTMRTSRVKAGTYRLKVESEIYDEIDGKVVETWEASTSFTSNIVQGDWIKITGYFVDRQWQKAQKPLWVKARNALKRD